MILRLKQGVNEKLFLELPFNPGPLEKFTVDIFQHGSKVLTKTDDDCTVEGNTILVELSQNDTMLLSPQRVALSLRGLYPDGGTVIMDELSCVIDRSSYREVIE